jgi:hypothetical protein
MVNVSPGPKFRITDPAELAQRAALEAAYKFHPLSATASLDPGTFGHVEPPSEPLKLNVQQINHPLAIRQIHQLHVPCTCGRLLCGIEDEWIFDEMGSAIHITGVCLTCGVQKVMYLAAPAVSANAQRLRLEANIRALLEQIENLPLPPDTATADTQEAA